MKRREKHAFFCDLSKELFRNVRQLYEQVDAQFTDRTPDESVGAQIASFCVYSCGLFSTYICKYPHSESRPCRHLSTLVNMSLAQSAKMLFWPGTAQRCSSA